MPTRFQTARFNVSFGPNSLFERVRFILREKRELKIHTTHFRQQAINRDAPIDELKKFDPAQWQLVTVEVRTDKGKFVSTAWRVELAGSSWWVVIGLHDTIETAFPINAKKLGRGDSIVTHGILYTFVEEVNRQLMAEIHDTGRA
ncbi:hypothetical protein EON83_25620 [bacterium]|nr:MAG: hypothetical protein EON83_25620 [bacterium]